MVRLSKALEAILLALVATDQAKIPVDTKHSSKRFEGGDRRWQVARVFRFGGL